MKTERATEVNRQTTYSSAQIATICEEIERQWDYHLVVRAAFPADAGKASSGYRSPGFYRHHGADLCISINNPDAALMRRALKGLPHWLNQNFVIRLFGLLDESGIITAGKESGNNFTAILAGLRHMVGAHSSGHPNPEKREFREVTGLIKAHLDSDIEVKSVRDFHL